MKTTYKHLQSFLTGALPDPLKLSEVIDNHSFEVEETIKLGNGDTQYDIAILPDRASDCLSTYGLAREIAHITNTILKPVDKKELRIDQQLATIPVTIDAGCALRYSARMIRLHNGFTGSSPLSAVVESFGQRSINTIVDASNVIMFLYGQPTHAFDADKIVGGIHVRRCGIETDFLALDNAIYKLLPNDIVIADDEKILAIAGVKGGFAAAITSTTQNIILEVANFHPTLVRSTARRLSLLTDAAKRFENNFPYNNVDVWMNEFTALLVENLDISIGAVTDSIADDVVVTADKTITVAKNLAEKILGNSVQDSLFVSVLESKGLQIIDSGDFWTVTVPYFRPDIDCKEAIIDEIARFVGYSMGESNWSVESNTALRAPITMNALVRYCTDRLLSSGFHEIMTYTFVESGSYSVMGSVASDKSALRTTLSQTGIEALQKNYHNRDLLGLVDVKLFEIGSAFPETGEVTHLSILCKKTKQKGVAEELSKIVSELFNACGITEELMIDAIVEKSDSLIEISLTKILSLCTNIPVVDAVSSNAGEQKSFRNWSPYPTISRDISVWVPASITSSELENLYRSVGGQLCANVFLLDTFEKEGRVSYAHRIVFQSMDNTLTESDIAEPFASIQQACTEKGWEIR